MLLLWFYIHAAGQKITLSNRLIVHDTAQLVAQWLQSRVGHKLQVPAEGALERPVIVETRAAELSRCLRTLGWIEVGLRFGSGWAEMISRFKIRELYWSQARAGM